MTTAICAAGEKMIEILTVIDGILKLAPVRWGLLVASVLLSASVAVQTVRFMAAENQRDAEAGRNATLGAAINAQNLAIKKAGDDMEAAKKRAQNANAEAAKIRKAYDERVRELTKVNLTGDCPQMVQTVLDEVRK